MARTFDYGALVRKAWGRSWREREPVYRMPNGRDFKDDDGVGGVYVGAAGAPRAMEDSSTRLLETGDRRLLE